MPSPASLQRTIPAATPMAHVRDLPGDNHLQGREIFHVVAEFRPQRRPQARERQKRERA